MPRPRLTLDRADGAARHDATFLQIAPFDACLDRVEQGQAKLRIRETVRQAAQVVDAISRLIQTLFEDDVGPRGRIQSEPFAAGALPSSGRSS